MGFFSDLKEDLSQAVNELLPEETTEELAGNPEALQEEAAAAPAEEMSFSAVNLSDMLDKMEAMDFEAEEPVVEEPIAEEPVVEEPVVEEPIAEEPIAEEPVVEEPIAEEPVIEEPIAEEPVVEEPIAEEPVIEEPVAEEPVPEEPVVQEEIKEEAVADVYAAEENKEKTEESIMEDNKDFGMEERRVAKDETALITVGMTIRGDVETEGSMDLIGKVIGNVDVLGKLNITGTIEGNSKASEIYAEKAHIIGEVKSEGAVKIGQNSVIIGNVFGNSAVVAGAVKGDIDIKGPVILDSTAIVMGNIKSKSVQINNGAVIEGMCSQCYADVTPTSFFDDFKLD